MTQPTIEELDRIDAADRYTRTALEFVWAFTEWWENIQEDAHGNVSLDSELAATMEQAYMQWRNTR